MTIQGAVNSALQAVGQFIIVALIGGWLAKRSYLDKQAIVKTGGMNFQALLPSLLFTAILGAISFNDLPKIWPLFVFAVISVASGYLLSFAIGRLLGIRTEILYYVVQCAAYGNTGYLPWLFLPAVITASNQFADTSSAVAASISYASLYTCALMVMLLTTPYLFIPATIKLPTAEHRPEIVVAESPVVDTGEDSLGLTGPDDGTVTIHLSPAVRHGSDGDSSAALVLADASTVPSLIERQTPGQHATRESHRWAVHGLTRTGSLKRIVTTLSQSESVQLASRTFKAAAQHPLFNLPMLACVAGVVIGVIDPVKTLFVDPGRPLNWLYLAAKYIGAASSPLAMLVLGAEAVHSSKQTIMGVECRGADWYRAVGVSAGVKLVLNPLLMVALTLPSVLGCMLPENDPVFKLVVLVESAVPAAPSLIVIGMSAVKDVVPFSKLVFWQYVLATVTLAGFTVWFLYMIE